MSGRGGIFHFEIMPKNIDKVVDSTVSIEGDVVTNMARLLPLLEYQKRSLWFDTLNEWKTKYPFTFTPSKEGEALKPQEVIQELNLQTKDIKDQVLITTGVGQHQMWACQHFRYSFILKLDGASHVPGFPRVVSEQWVLVYRQPLVLR